MVVQCDYCCWQLTVFLMIRPNCHSPNVALTTLTHTFFSRFLHDFIFQKHFHSCFSYQVIKWVGLKIFTICAEICVELQKSFSIEKNLGGKYLWVHSVQQKTTFELCPVKAIYFLVLYLLVYIFLFYISSFYAFKQKYSSNLNTIHTVLRSLYFKQMKTMSYVWFHPIFHKLKSI